MRPNKKKYTSVNMILKIGLGIAFALYGARQILSGNAFVVGTIAVGVGGIFIRDSLKLFKQLFDSSKSSLSIQEKHQIRVDNSLRGEKKPHYSGQKPLPKLKSDEVYLPFAGRRPKQQAFEGSKSANNLKNRV